LTHIYEEWTYTVDKYTPVILRRLTGIYDARGQMVQASTGANVTKYDINDLGQRVRETGLVSQARPVLYGQ
jgi:YD repeat-containing protein